MTRLLIDNRIPISVEHAVSLLEPLTIGFSQTSPLLPLEARLFRVRVLKKPPTKVSDLGAPPDHLASMGRVNDTGKSVLYLSDLPRTAIAETRVKKGSCCLTEWRITANNLLCANGGIPIDLLSKRFKSVEKPIQKFTKYDFAISALFRTAYTLDKFDGNQHYIWSIASALVNGFAPICDLQEQQYKDGVTELKGKYPLAAVAYPSIRDEMQYLNYAFNDRGQTHVALKNIQWIDIHENGQITSLNFADSWSENGTIDWKNRPANYRIGPKQSAIITRVSEKDYLFEMADGSLPFYC